MPPLPNNTSESNRPVRQKNTEKSVLVMRRNSVLLWRNAHWLIDRPSVHERTEKTASCSAGTTVGYGYFRRLVWFIHAERSRTRWKPRVEPYVGYGTTKFSRIICRTVYGSTARTFRRRLGRGIPIFSGSSSSRSCAREY